MHVDTEIEPPGLAVDDDGGDDTPQIGVHAALFEADDTRRCGMTHLDADALIQCVLGTAAMRGPDLLAAVQRRVIGRV